MNFELKNIIRKNILELKPYSSARNEYSGSNVVLLDANENPYNEPYNRYPDPGQQNLKSKVSELYHIPVSNIFLGNGSDEAIDLLIRAFCEPSVDRIISIEPSYGMYKVCADIQNVAVDGALLNIDFSLNLENILSQIQKETKIIFLCSPNNPSGNLLEEVKIIKLLEEFKGIVVVDEAYIDFANSDGLLKLLPGFPNMVILRTFSKAWGLAGIRLGMAFASQEIINILNKIKYPYNLNILTQNYALGALSSAKEMKIWVDRLISERERIRKELTKLPVVERVFHSDANFLLIKTTDPAAIYKILVGKGIIVRDRSKVPLCEACLRITIGSKEENDLLLDSLKSISL
ncbi:MAG: histidinol-phosphate transaminase [Bacteroidales bacterium]|nr:histidinol-phosphate transaminase [Bacteroidales bacterium]